MTTSGKIILLSTYTEKLSFYQIHPYTIIITMKLYYIGEKRFYDHSNNHTSRKS